MRFLFGKPALCCVTVNSGAHASLSKPQVLSKGKRKGFDDV
jgi:hypothetical protein